LLELNRERAIKKKEEERLEEIAKQKKLQEQQAQQTYQGKPVVGASLNV